MKPNQQFADDIAAYRKQAVTEAAKFALDADWPADQVAAYAYLAGEYWDREHPTLRSRLPEAIR